MKKEEPIIMKRMLRVTTFVFALTLLVTMIAGTALAAGSKSEVVEVTASANGAAVELSYCDDNTSWPPLTKEIAASKIDGAKPEEMEVIWARCITSPTLPVDLTFKTEVGKNQTAYVYHYDGSQWNLMGKANTAITFTSLSPVGIAIRTVSDSSQGGEGKSPATGDDGLLVTLACIAVLMGTAVACISLRKKA